MSIPNLDNITQLKQWNEIYKAAATSLENREEKIQEAAELIENGLVILGATAVEDKLQLVCLYEYFSFHDCKTHWYVYSKGVPETIEKLKLAGINVWVLTGDKLETAVNIGFSCRLLSDEIKLISLVDNNEVSLRISKSYCSIAWNIFIFLGVQYNYREMF